MAKKTFETVLKWNGGEAFRAKVEVGTDGWGRVFDTADISYGVPIIQLFEDGRALGTRDYSSPKRAINAIREILRCAGYEL